MLRERPLGHFVVAPDEAALSGGAVFLYAERELKRKYETETWVVCGVSWWRAHAQADVYAYRYSPPSTWLQRACRYVDIRCGRHLQRPLAVLAHALSKRLRSDLRMHSTVAPSARGSQCSRPPNLKLSTVSLDHKHGDRK